MEEEVCCMDAMKVRTAEHELVDRMVALGYSEFYVRELERLCRWLADEADGFEGWAEVERAVRAKWASDSAYRRMLRHLRRIVNMVEHGELPVAGGTRIVADTARSRIGEGFGTVLETYEKSRVASRKSPSTVRGELSCAACFFERLEGLGCGSPSDATEDVVLSILVGPDGRPAYSSAYAQRIRAVLNGAAGIAGCEGLASAIPVPRRWRKLCDVLDGEEREAMRRTLEGDVLSQRDRAIGCVLYYTGMRACDVAALRLDSIDWELDLVELVQVKTGVPLALPLTAHVGNAIWDYVNGDRGANPSPNVFVSMRWPYGALSAGAVRSVSAKVFDAAGVRCAPGCRRGTHLFRRTAATAMLGSGADRSVIAAALGHSSPVTTERYIAADVDGLRRRAIDVSCFPVAEGVLS